MKRVLVSFSGGADSTTLLYDCFARYRKENVEAIHFDYGQRHAEGERRAVVAIEKHAQKYIETLGFDLKQFGRSPLVDMDLAVPAQAEKKQGITVVPYRNSMFLVLAAAYATVHEFDTIAFGATYEDLAEYPDCRPDYFSAMQHAMRLADRHYHLEIFVPYNSIRKKEVIKRGLQVRAPYELTHTCYEGHYLKPCHVCDACCEREQSFVDNGVTDPLVL